MSLNRAGGLVQAVADDGSGGSSQRTTRFAMLMHLPPMDGHGRGPRVKNGPALAGHGAEALRDAIASTIATLPMQLRQLLDALLRSDHTDVAATG